MPTPSRFTEARRARLIAILASGGSRAAAARAAAIHPSTLSRWLARGRTAHPEGRWAAFYREVERVERLAPTLQPIEERDPLFPTPAAALRYLERHEPVDPPEFPRVIHLRLPDDLLPHEPDLA
jgi:hypothetical protein